MNKNKGTRSENQSLDTLGTETLHREVRQVSGSGVLPFRQDRHATGFVELIDGEAETAFLDSGNLGEAETTFSGNPESCRSARAPGLILKYGRHVRHARLKVRGKLDLVCARSAGGPFERASG